VRVEQTKSVAIYVSWNLDLLSNASPLIMAKCTILDLNYTIVTV
jgi:hypothetical protein